MMKRELASLSELPAHMYFGAPASPHAAYAWPNQVRRLREVQKAEHLAPRTHVGAGRRVLIVDGLG